MSRTPRPTKRSPWPEEAIASGKVSAEDYDRIVQPHTMIGDGLSGA